MDTHGRVERIVFEYVQKALRVGFLSVTEKTETRLHVHLGGFPVSLSHKVPIEFFDVSALKAVQIEMLKQLFQRYAVLYPEAEGQEMIAALIGSTLERYARAFVKAIPIVGKLVWEESEAVLAGASTYALAKIAILRLELDQSFAELNFLAVKQVYAAEFKTGKAVAAKIAKEEVGTILLFDIETIKQRYAQACRPKVTPADDPFAIYVDDAPATSANTANSANAAPADGSVENTEARLARLTQLKEKKFITEEEFVQCKQKILNQR